MNPTAYLLLGVEQYLWELPDDDFNELVQRARPPAGKATGKRSSAGRRSSVVCEIATRRW